MRASDDRQTEEPTPWLEAMISPSGVRAQRREHTNAEHTDAEAGQPIFKNEKRKKRAQTIDTCGMASIQHDTTNSASAAV